MAELGTEGVLKDGELFHSIVRHDQQRTGDHLVVVIDALNGKVIVTGPLTAYRWTRPGADTAAAGDTRLQQG